MYVVLGIAFMWCFVESFKDTKYKKFYIIGAGLILGLVYKEVQNLLSIR